MKYIRHKISLKKHDAVWNDQNHFIRLYYYSTIYFSIYIGAYCGNICSRDLFLS